MKYIWEAWKEREAKRSANNNQLERNDHVRIGEGNIWQDNRVVDIEQEREVSPV